MSSTLKDSVLNLIDGFSGKIVEERDNTEYDEKEVSQDNDESNDNSCTNERNHDHESENMGVVDELIMKNTQSTPMRSRKRRRMIGFKN